MATTLSTQADVFWIKSQLNLHHYCNCEIPDSLLFTFIQIVRARYPVMCTRATSSDHVMNDKWQVNGYMFLGMQ